MEWLHLTGPPPAIHRLESLAADLGVAHDVTDGVLRVPLDAVDRLVDGSGSVLAPLEAGLVLAVRADPDAGSPLALLALAAMAPTLAQLVARKAHRVLLAAIESREAVSVGFQPVVDLRTGLTAGFEALLRVRIGRHVVSPAEVLAVADEAGRLREVDAIARSIAVTEAATAIGDRILFLNVLPASLPVPFEDLAPFAAEVIERGLDPTRIVLESPVGPAGALRRHLRAVFEAGRAAGFLVGLDNVRSERDLAAISFR
ncbi:MAG: hypothetical protein QOI47_2489, partial [Actinomycetota bacterium]|nr:hypothetical protein [Actinomycetota bacterium]